MSPKSISRSCISYLLLTLVLLLSAGCQHHADTQILPPVVTITGLRAVMSDSIIPVTLWVYSETRVTVNLILEVKEGLRGEYQNVSAVPGEFNPVSIVSLDIPEGGTRIKFNWHAINDLESGNKHENVYLRATCVTPDGGITRDEKGPFVVDYSAAYFGTVPPHVKSGNLADGFCGEPYFAELPVEGGTPPIVWELWPPGTHLPSFLNFNPDGTISGDIPAYFGYTSLSFAAKATDSNIIRNRSSAGLFTIYFQCDIVPPDAPPVILFDGLPEGTEGEFYYFQCTAFGGDGELTWSIETGDLPNGLGMSEGGTITGTPEAGSEGEYYLTVRVCDSYGLGPQCDEVDVTLAIRPEIGCDDPPVIDEQSIPGAIEGEEYSHQVTVEGGDGELSWSIIDGQTPSGIVLTENGLLTGTPKPGTGGDTGNQWVFVVEVCDSCILGPQCDSRELVLPVAPAGSPCAPPPVILTETTLPDAAVNHIYNFQFTSSGGEGNLTWILNNHDEKPDGLTFTSIGNLSGIPAEGSEGNYSLDVAVEDECPEVQTDSRIFLLTVQDDCASGPFITTENLNDMTEGVPYYTKLNTFGGEEPLRWYQSGGPSLPDGVLLSEGGVISGIPATGTAGYYEGIEITVEDSCWLEIQTDVKTYDFAVQPASGCAIPPVITEDQHAAPAGSLIDYYIPADYGEGELSWEIVEPDPSMPDMIVLESDGHLFGEAGIWSGGTYTFTVRVMDSCNDPGPQYTDGEFNLFILEASGCSEDRPFIEDAEIYPPIANGEGYSHTMSVHGGEGQLHWSSYGLPPGLEISELTGKIQGSVELENAGTWHFYISVADSCEPVAQVHTVAYDWNIQGEGWARSWQSQSGTFAQDVETVANGDIIMVGWFRSILDFDAGPGEDIHPSSGAKDGFLIKNDAWGQYLWGISFGGNDNDMVEIKDIVVNYWGNIYLGGIFSGSSIDFDPGDGEYIVGSNGENDCFLLKLDPDGNFMRVITWGSTTYDHVNDIAVDGEGRVAAVGTFSGTVDFDPGVGTVEYTPVYAPDVYLVQYDQFGELSWVDVWDEGGQIAVAIDGHNQIYTGGSFSGLNVDLDPGPGTEIFTADGSSDACLIKLNSDGEYVWAGTWGGSGWDYCYALATSDTAVFTAGYFMNTCDFDPGVSTTEHTSAGQFDGYVSRFSQTGNFEWVETWGDAENNLCKALDADPGGNVLAVSWAYEDINNQTSMKYFNHYGVLELEYDFESTDRAYGTGASIDEGGYLVITGYFDGGLDLGPVFPPCSEESFQVTETTLSMGAFLARYKPNGCWLN